VPRNQRETSHATGLTKPWVEDDDAA
jgi:hypothetical protein